MDSSLASFVACGDGGAASLGSNLLVVGQADDTPGIDSRDNDPDRGPVRISLDHQASKLAKSNGTGAQRLDRSQLTNATPSPSSPSRAAVRVHHSELARWREFNTFAKLRQTAAALDAGTRFLADAPGSPLVATALVRLASLADRGNTALHVSEILAEQAKQLPRAEDRRLARLLSLREQAVEGSPQAAITGLEEMIETADTPQDSLRALVTAMGVYLHYGRDGQLRVRKESIRVDDPRELARRVVRYAKAMQNPALLAVKATPAIPTEYRLYQNFPNPFNPNTEIRFDLPEAVQVQLRIFNILGQEVATLVDELKPAGAYNLRWDSKSATGSVVASGVYVYQLKAGKFVDQKKMVLIR